MSTYSSDPELRGVTDDDGHGLDVASSPADRLVRVIAFDAGREPGDDVTLYLEPLAALRVASALVGQVQRLLAAERRGGGRA